MFELRQVLPLIAVLVLLSQVARGGSLDDFEEKAVSFHRQFQDLLTDAKEGRERELAERMTDLTESRKLDLSQRKEKSRSIKTSLETVRGIILALQSVFPAND